MSGLRVAISPASFWVPEYICQSAWIEHAPFAFWLCDAVRPRQFVELGTHHGYSYFVICQAIDRLGIGTTAYAVDNWQGDEHAGFYDESVFQSVAQRNREKYSAFSTLIRSSFDDALGYFPDGSVDLLHIDGRHLYGDVAHDFATWRPKLTDDAVVLFHDTNVRERAFGVWKFFAELAVQYPSFQFFHGHGLGVLIPGARMPPALSPLLDAATDTADQIRAAYGALGATLSVRSQIVSLGAAVAERDREIAELRGASVLESEALRAHIGLIEQERDGLTAMLDAARAEMACDKSALAEREVALAEASRRAEDRAGTLRSTQEVLATRDAEMRDTLERIEHEAQERAAAEEAMQAEVEVLRGNLERGQHELRERAAAGRAMQAEVEALRGTLERAQREARERAGTADAMQAEINTLRSERDAARDVGKAALAALRPEPAPVSQAPKSGGRLTNAFRLFGSGPGRRLTAPG